MAYSKITLYDNQTVDYLVLLDHSATADEINVAKSNHFIPNWSSFKGIEIMAPFTSDLVSSYIKGLTSNLVGFEIYRQKKGETVIHFVASVVKEKISVIDYLVGNRTDYRWTVVPITEEQVGVSLMSPYLTTDFNGWSVTALNKMNSDYYFAGDTWLFTMGLGSPITPSPYVQNLDVTQFKTLSQFPKFAKGSSNYISGSVSCLLGNVNCQTGGYYEPADKINAWRKFVADGGLFLLKDIQGQVIMCNIFESSNQPDASITEQPNTITFSFVETASTDNISVYKE